MNDTGRLHAARLKNALYVLTAREAFKAFLDEVVRLIDAGEPVPSERTVGFIEAFEDARHHATVLVDKLVAGEEVDQRVVDKSLAVYHELLESAKSSDTADRGRKWSQRPRVAPVTQRRIARMNYRVDRLAAHSSRALRDRGLRRGCSLRRRAAARQRAPRRVGARRAMGVRAGTDPGGEPPGEPAPHLLGVVFFEGATS